MPKEDEDVVKHVSNFTYLSENQIRRQVRIYGESDTIAMLVHHKPMSAILREKGIVLETHHESPRPAVYEDGVHLIPHHHFVKTKKIVKRLVKIMD